ncbi:unnamed protein product [Closterium sp. Yama58-4]|nr:unnamed protein product [Closterium sp. Yama58-4]
MPLLFFIPDRKATFERGALEGNPPLLGGGEGGSAVGDDGGGSNALVIASAASCARGGSRPGELRERLAGTGAELASGADVAADVALDNDELELVDERKKRRNSKRVQRKLRRIQGGSSKQKVERAKAFLQAGLTPPAALQALLLRERRAGGRGEAGSDEEGSEEEDEEESEDERVEGLLSWKDERGRARSGGGEGEESGVGEMSEGAVMRGEEGMGGTGEGGKSVGMEVEMREMETEGTGGGEGVIKERETGGKRDTSRESSGEEESRGEGSREEGEVSDSDDGEEGEDEGKQHGEEVGDEGMVDRQGLLGEQEGHRMEDDEAARKEEHARDDVIRAEEGEQQEAAESEGAAVEAEQRKQGGNMEGRVEQGGGGGGKEKQGGGEGRRGGKLWVRVERREEIEAQRAGLPVVAMEGEVMEAVGSSNAVLVCGETGSGKTTQVPQFLYEAGYGSSLPGGVPGMIAVTQPRRVAVLATAKRIADEMGVTVGREVGYQVRYDRHVAGGTAIKIMTDGILLREVQADLLLRQYSAVVLDEAHERSVNTDILVGLLSRIVPLRQKLHDEAKAAGRPSSAPPPLKLIIMSATLRISDFTLNTRLFPAGPPPVVSVPARQFPVTVHFARRTELVDYVRAAEKKVSAIHRKLPPGGVLVFLTGQREVEDLCRKLRKKFPMKGEGVEMQQVGEEQAAGAAGVAETAGPAVAGEVTGAAEAAGGGAGPGSGASPLSKGEQAGPGGKGEQAGPGGMYVLPLYAMLPAAQQLKVFGAVPEGCRLVVVATNVAETSITIPGIRYVVDTGRAKVKQHTGGAGLARFTVEWISRASADQRAGRAGRVGPGQCYRLFSSAVFANQFEAFGQAEIERTPIEGVVLQMKAMGIDKGERKGEGEGEVGRVSALVVRYAIAVVAAMSVESPFLRDNDTGDTGTAGQGDSGGTGERGDGADGRSGEERESRAGVGGGADHAAAAAAAAAAAPPNGKALSRHAAHALFWSRSSDAITAANALRAYDAAVRAGKGGRNTLPQAGGAAQSRSGAGKGDRGAGGWGGAGERFCQRFYLRERCMREMSQLAHQLSRLLVAGTRAHLLQSFLSYALSSSPSTSSHPAAPVPLTLLVERGEQLWAGREGNKEGRVEPQLREWEEGLIRRGLAAGWPDRLARKMAPGDKPSAAGSAAGATHSLPKRAVRYEALFMEEPVLLHPRSATFRSAPPLLLFNEIVQTESHPFLVTTTAVDPAWLPSSCPALCSLSKPLPDPPPRYHPPSDRILATVAAVYGPKRWPLPHCTVDLEGSRERAAVFACALLQGQVVGAMKRLQGLLAGNLTSLLRPEGLGQRRAGDLVHSKGKLRAAWECDGEFLRAEVRSWVRAGQEGVVDGLWRDIVREAVVGAKKQKR